MDYEVIKRENKEMAVVFFYLVWVREGWVGCEEAFD